MPADMPCTSASRRSMQGGVLPKVWWSPDFFQVDTHLAWQQTQGNLQDLGYGLHMSAQDGEFCNGNESSLDSHEIAIESMSEV